MPSASRLLTAVRAHERASAIPKLHRANTVAWGLLKGDRCCMIAVSHWSKPAWQNRASLLTAYCGFLHTPQYAVRREVRSPDFQKTASCKGERVTCIFLVDEDGPRAPRG